MKGLSQEPGESSESPAYVKTQGYRGVCAQMASLRPFQSACLSFPYIMGCDLVQHEHVASASPSFGNHQPSSNVPFSPLWWGDDAGGAGRSCRSERGKPAVWLSDFRISSEHLCPFGLISAAFSSCWDAGGDSDSPGGFRSTREPGVPGSPGMDVFDPSVKIILPLFN